MPDKLLFRERYSSTGIVGPYAILHDFKWCLNTRRRQVWEEYEWFGVVIWIEATHGSS